jgi:hypothetical protein
VDDLKFKALLDAYGADVERWPQSEREAGRRRLADAAAQGSAELNAAAALDALLAGRRPVVARVDLVGRIMASLETRSDRGRLGVVAAAGLALRARLVAAGVLLVAVGMAAGWGASHGVVGSAAGGALLDLAYGGTADDLFAAEEL